MNDGLSTYDELDRLTLTELALLLGWEKSNLSQEPARSKLPEITERDHSRISPRSLAVGGRPPSTVQLYKLAEIAQSRTSHLTDEECRLRVAFCSAYEDVHDRDDDLRREYDGYMSVSDLIRSLRTHMAHYAYYNRANDDPKYMTRAERGVK